MGNHEVERGKSVDASGGDVDEAIQNALERLDRSRDEVEVTVLREPRSGVLGLGARDAIVRVTELIPVEQPDDAPPPAPSVETPAPDVTTLVEEEAPEREAVVEMKEGRTRLQELTDEQQHLLELGHEILVELLTRMRVIADVQAYWAPPEAPGEEPTLRLDVVGDDLGLLIGRRGTTLGALQFMMRLLVGRKVEDYVNLVVDVDGYKRRRAERLRNLARRKAEQVRRTDEPVHLKPMSAYERRIVHLALRNDPDVTTESTGKDPQRRVGIFPT